MDEKADLDKNDHRRLGQELDLFVFSDLVGAGLPLWTPRGTVIRAELDRYVQEMRDGYGFQAVTIPHITKKDLYEKSGHWTKFKNDLFHVKSREGHEFAMKPMNCPHHAQIYASRPRSYRELPIRYRETTMNYRDEQSGELNGILRARSFTQDDAHVFCREEDIVQEVLNLWDVVERFYKTLNFELSLRFSKRDPATSDAYAGTPELWELAEAELQKAMDKKGIKNEQEGLGDAAFYGPKLDFVAKDSLNREWQVATIQLDFAQPEGLELTYTNDADEEKRPVMIHCAVMGSIERFLGVYIEHVSGRFPLWLAPEQLRVATLNDDERVVELAKAVVAKAKAQGLRVELDDSNESVGKKIRDAETMKVPYTVVIGSKEVESGQLSPRTRSDLSDKANTVGVDDFLEKLSQDAKSRL
ncbi:MAG TPA: threonine--tRNA ligase [Candidatus Binatia bacterium]|nr:threonine--tRNA ligase [Candidatus Binatia bacterium]